MQSVQKGFQTFRTLTFFVPRRVVPQESLILALTLTITRVVSETLTPTPNPNINANPNRNSRYLTLTLFKNTVYETPGYEKVRVRNV